MSIRTEIDRIIGHVSDAHERVKAKGGTTAAPYLIANLADAIDTIPEAVDPKLQSKTVAPSTSSQTVKPDSGYDGLSQVTVNAMPTATQATPSISVSSAGLITASATQSAGYVAAGTKSATKQLTTQAAQTITPGTSDKTIASGRYLTGTQTIKGDANLVAGNIKSGVNIFGVSGTLTEGEDVTAETDAYTDLITDLETAIDALPDAGSGGSGGGSIETCTFIVTTHGIADFITEDGYTATVYENGRIGCIYRDTEGNAPSLVIENVVCGSVVAIRLHNAMSVTVNNCEYMGMINGVRIIKVTAPNGGTATLSATEL